ncbi:MAG TPA: hypothetical protein VGQ22_05300 [Steroidobacteraceae bacterium]|jgi:hypothetical protein|nr:hypothetical protein [Steroidobacteraceae bacterium]
MQQDEEAGLPVRAGLAPTGLYLALRQIGRDELQDAFMQETIARVPAEERIVQVVRDGARLAREAAPSGIIFHVARCGSTLVSQSLKRLDGLVVYAEPQPVNEILAPPHRWPRADRVAALRSLAAAFARHARGRYVLKLSSWNTLYCDVVAEAFPDTPWVLSFRDPVEVGVSLIASPPGWFQGTAEAARELAARVDPDHAAKSREEFVASVYGAFCAAAAGLDAGRGRLVPYESLPAAVWEIVAPHFSLSVDPSQRDRIAEGARRHAKAAIGTAAEFKSDVASKQGAASAELRRAIDSLARPQLERLLRLHAATMPR